jgi:DNA replication protein DnaC
VTTRTTTTEAASLAAIGAATRELHLPTIREQARSLAEAAERSRSSHLAYLADVLAAETDDRAERRRLRRIKEAHFPRSKSLADFDTSVSGPIDAKTIALLASCSYLDKAEPIVLLGDSGTGKSHLLIGLGTAACERGHSVRYVTCAQLVNELAEAADERRLSRLVARYGRLELLLIDELGYVKLDVRGAELLFQILTAREERSSVAVASNLPFSEWGQVVTDARLVAAVVDRLTFRAHIIETGTESFRLGTARKGRQKPQ